MPKIITPSSSDWISLSHHELSAGNLVAFPTETVYGLGADATQEEAVRKIFTLKNRPQFNPLIVHCYEAAQVWRLVDAPPLALELAQKFWPGPLTMILPKKPNSSLAPSVSASLATIGVRVPAHPVAQRLLKEYGKPIAAPSANISGKLSCTNAAAVAQNFPNILIINGGDCQIGLESTIVKFLPPSQPPSDTNILTILRYGGITPEQIQTALAAHQYSLHIPNEAHKKIEAPGMLSSHYAPNLTLRLNATFAEPNESFLTFGPSYPNNPPRILNLSPAGDLYEAAHNLFNMLRLLDNKDDFIRIAVAPIPMTGIGLAINDRLMRAAAPRANN